MDYFVANFDSKMKKLFISLLLLSSLFVSNKVVAQDSFEATKTTETAESPEKAEKEFIITGSPIVTVFANYHAGIGDNNEISGFALTRAYLGYQFRLSPTLTGKAIIDAAVSPTETYLISQKREVYLKNAMLTWKDMGFTVNGGLTSLSQFNLQEKFWGYRYVAPSFQDLYKMGPSADLGITAEYQFMPCLSTDISFTNGEGYRNLNMDNKYRYAFGITLKPLENFTVRAYGDVYQQSGQEKDQRTLALFAGYKTKLFSLGAEYNYQENNKWKTGDDYSGYSVYTSLPINKKWTVFGRYDNIDSQNTDDKSWISFTGEAVTAGVEYQPIKQLKIAPNYKYTKDFDTELLVRNSFHVVYLNVSFNW